MPKRKHNDDSCCRVCGGSDDSNNGEGPCLECQVDIFAMEADRVVDMARDGKLPRIACALMQRKKFSDV